MHLGAGRRHLDFNDARQRNAAHADAAGAAEGIQVSAFELSPRNEAAKVQGEIDARGDNPKPPLGFAPLAEYRRRRTEVGPNDVPAHRRDRPAHAHNKQLRAPPKPVAHGNTDGASPAMRRAHPRCCPLRRRLLGHRREHLARRSDPDEPLGSVDKGRRRSSMGDHRRSALPQRRLSVPGIRPPNTGRNIENLRGQHDPPPVLLGALHRRPENPRTRHTPRIGARVFAQCRERRLRLPNPDGGLTPRPGRTLRRFRPSEGSATPHTPNQEKASPKHEATTPQTHRGSLRFCRAEAKS